MVHQDADRCLQRRAANPRGSQPRTSASAIARTPTPCAVRRPALRQIERPIVLALPRPNPAVPDRSTLSRRIETLRVALPRPGIAPVPGDSTGLTIGTSDVDEPPRPAPCSTSGRVRDQGRAALAHGLPHGTKIAPAAGVLDQTLALGRLQHVRLT